MDPLLLGDGDDHDSVLRQVGLDRGQLGLGWQGVAPAELPGGSNINIDDIFMVCRVAVLGLSLSVFFLVYKIKKL